jgi:signal transduction histidine kinase
VAKYARAATVHVRVATNGSWADIAVRDDGVGFDPTAARAAAHGLAGMRFRVQSGQGELKIKSRPGSGTTIHARLPLSQASPDAAEDADDVAALLGPGEFPKPPASVG